MSGRVLERSSRGDRRFSDVSARVRVLGRDATIAEHYRLASRFAPGTWRGRWPTYFEIGGVRLPVEMSHALYDLLWVKYLDAHSELVAVAAAYDGFHNAFARLEVNDQAETIRRYVKDGRTSIMARPDVRELVEQMRGCGSGS